MKNKKLFARIGAILACVLLVGALAVPCFADDSEEQSSNGTSLDIAWAEYLPQSVKNTHIYRDFPYFPPNVDILTLGTISLDRVNLGWIAGKGIYGSSELTVYNDVCVQLLMNSVREGYEGLVEVTIQGARMVYDLRNDYEDNTLEVYFNGSDSSSTARIYLRYDLDLTETEPAYAVLTEAVIDGISYFNNAYDSDTGEYINDIDFIEIGLEYDYEWSAAHVPPESLSFVYNIASLLYGYNANDCVVFPKTFLTAYNLGTKDNADYSAGYSEGYDAGYGVGLQEGITQGFQSGRVDGYEEGHGDGLEEGLNAGIDIGYEEGYQVGYTDGISENVSYSDGYDDGYEEAVRQIESGDFGRNFLGDIFGNITVAINEFRLFQYDGTWVTLGTVLAASIGISLFIWLLKCMT